MTFNGFPFLQVFIPPHSGIRQFHNSSSYPLKYQSSQFSLKIRLYCKQELLYKDFLESAKSLEEINTIIKA